MLGTMPHLRPSHMVRYEFRYPYLDRDLVDFLLRVPRERLLRPGRRRALMRSALRLMVPTEVLERRRKGARNRSLLLALKSQEQELCDLFQYLPEPLKELVDGKVLQQKTLEVVRKDDLGVAQGVVRVLLLALWCKAYESRRAEGRLLSID